MCIRNVQGYLTAKTKQSKFENGALFDRANIQSNTFSR